MKLDQYRHWKWENGHALCLSLELLSPWRVSVILWNSCSGGTLAPFQRKEKKRKKIRTMKPPQMLNWEILPSDLGYYYYYYYYFLTSDNQSAVPLQTIFLRLPLSLFLYDLKTMQQQRDNWVLRLLLLFLLHELASQEEWPAGWVYIL